MSRTTYEKQTWHDLPEEDTPISAERLSHIEDGIADAANNRALKEIYADNSMGLGAGSKANGTYSMANGYYATANGANSHAEGFYTIVTGSAAHAEGNSCNAAGDYSHAEGNNTIAYGESQHVEGKYNITDSSGIYQHIVGAGMNDSIRANIETLDWNGNLWVAGDVTNRNGDSLIGKVNKPSTNGTAGQILSTNGDGTTQWINNIPAPPAGDGNYMLSCTVSGGVATYEWITA